MNSLVEKLKEIEREVAEERGGIVLFALFEREELPGKWDLVISAPWVGESRRSAIAYVVEKVRARLDPAEFLSISRIVPLRPTEEFVRAIHQTVRVEHGLAPLHNQMVNGMLMNRGYVITSQP
jgi:hypothetical protein